MVARELGIRPDRIQQLEQHGTAHLRAALADGPAMMAAEALERLVGEVEPVDRILERLPVLGRSVPYLEAPLWRIVAVVGRRVWEEDGWIGSAPIAYTAAHTLNRITEAATDGAASTLDAVRHLLPSILEERDAAAWLAHCGIAVGPEGRLTALADIADHAARELVRCGTAQHLDALAEAAPGYTRQTVAAALAADARFERDTTGTYRLAAWGQGAQPREVAEMIRTALNAAGGRIRVDDLAAGLAVRYGAAEREVRRIAATVPFQVVDGTVKWFIPRRA